KFDSLPALTEAVRVSAGNSHSASASASASDAQAHADVQQLASLLASDSLKVLLGEGKDKLSLSAAEIARLYREAGAGAQTVPILRALDAAGVRTDSVDALIQAVAAQSQAVAQGQAQVAAFLSEP